VWLFFGLHLAFLFVCLSCGAHLSAPLFDFWDSRPVVIVLFRFSLLISFRPFSLLSFGLLSVATGDFARVSEVRPSSHFVIPFLRGSSVFPFPDPTSPRFVRFLRYFLVLNLFCVLVDAMSLFIDCRLWFHVVSVGFFRRFQVLMPRVEEVLDLLFSLGYVVV